MPRIKLLDFTVPDDGDGDDGWAGYHGQGDFEFTDSLGFSYVRIGTTAEICAKLNIPFTYTTTIERTANGRVELDMNSPTFRYDGTNLIEGQEEQLLQKIEDSSVIVKKDGVFYIAIYTPGFAKGLSLMDDIRNLDFEFALNVNGRPVDVKVNGTIEGTQADCGETIPPREFPPSDDPQDPQDPDPNPTNPDEFEALNDSKYEGQAFRNSAGKITDIIFHNTDGTTFNASDPDGGIDVTINDMYRDEDGKVYVEDLGANAAPVPAGKLVEGQNAVEANSVVIKGGMILANGHAHFLTVGEAQALFVVNNNKVSVNADVLTSLLTDNPDIAQFGNITLTARYNARDFMEGITDSVGENNLLASGVEDGNLGIPGEIGGALVNFHFNLPSFDAFHANNEEVIGLELLSSREFGFQIKQNNQDLDVLTVNIKNNDIDVKDGTEHLGAGQGYHILDATIGNIVLNNPSEVTATGIFTMQSDGTVKINADALGNFLVANNVSVTTGFEIKVNHNATGTYSHEQDQDGGATVTFKFENSAGIREYHAYNDTGEGVIYLSDTNDLSTITSVDSSSVDAIQNDGFYEAGALAGDPGDPTINTAGITGIAIIINSAVYQSTDTLDLSNYVNVDMPGIISLKNENISELLTHFNLPHGANSLQIQVSYESFDDQTDNDVKDTNEISAGASVFFNFSFAHDEQDTSYDTGLGNIGPIEDNNSDLLTPPTGSNYNSLDNVITPAPITPVAPVAPTPQIAEITISDRAISLHTIGNNGELRDAGKLVIGYHYNISEGSVVLTQKGADAANYIRENHSSDHTLSADIHITTTMTDGSSTTTLQKLNIDSEVSEGLLFGAGGGSGNSASDGESYAIATDGMANDLNSSYSTGFIGNQTTNSVSNNATANTPTANDDEPIDLLQGRSIMGNQGPITSATQHDGVIEIHAQNIGACGSNRCPTGAELADILNQLFGQGASSSQASYQPAYEPAYEPMPSYAEADQVPNFDTFHF